MPSAVKYAVEDDRINVDDLITSAGRQLREDFREIQQCNPHSGEKGSEAEEILKQFLRARLPRRFDVGAGIVLGTDGAASRQSDVIIYDSINSPIYRTGTRLQILPRDNVPAVIEVKSKLNKDELKDAAGKIASVKKIKASPICGADQPVTFSDLITTSVFGCVFAFDSYTSLETLAENLQEINETQHSDQWIDLVVVLDKGCSGYALQSPFEQKSAGWLGGASGDEFPIPPFGIHLVYSELEARALNHFFVRLMSHLTFFRKISAFDFAAFSRATNVPGCNVQSYQYDLARRLVPIERRWQQPDFKFSDVRFNIYSGATKRLAGQICFFPWQDGAVITFSTLFNPAPLFARFLAELRVKGQLIPAQFTPDATLLVSTVLPLSEDKFVAIAEKLHTDFITIRDSDDDHAPKTML